ncbi:MAG: AIM24 family protein [Candidatus Promineofilum sp.]|nr:AIM24 family protein [Promineifilum sp.]
MSVRRRVGHGEDGSGVGRWRKIGGLKSTLFSGEGLVVDLTGPGRVLAQTRSTDQFLSWLIPKLPRTSSGSGSG